MQDAQDKTPDPLVLGKAEPDEVATIGALKEQVNSLVFEVGRKELDLSRMDAHRKQVEEHKNSMILRIEQIEAEGKTLLEGIQVRFGIPDGEPWQYLPDGTVRRVDMNALKAAQASVEAATRAQEGETSEEAPAETVWKGKTPAEMNAALAAKRASATES